MDLAYVTLREGESKANGLGWGGVALSCYKSHQSSTKNKLATQQSPIWNRQRSRSCISRHSLRLLVFCRGESLVREEFTLFR